ncbi:MAG: 50S ribosomal protein L10 [bacterium]
MRLEKQAILEEITSRVNESSFVLVAEYRGMKVDQFSDLRRKLNKAGARMQVVKNRFLRLITREKGWQDLDASLKGQSAIVTGTDVVQAAKTLKQFSSANGLPLMKAGVMGNTILTAAQIDALAELPPREVLLGQVVGTVAAPLTRLVGVLKQKVSTIVYVLKAIEDKKNVTK